MTATFLQRLRRAQAKSRPPCTDGIAVGQTLFYDLKNANGAYLLVRVTGITHKRVVIVQVDGDGRVIGCHRSVKPARLVVDLPTTATVVG